MSRINMGSKQLLIHMVIGLFIGEGRGGEGKYDAFFSCHFSMSFYGIVLSLSEGGVYIHA